MIFALARTIVYAALFIGFLLVFLPGRLLAASGVTPPSELGGVQWAGMLVTALGGVLALWCVFTISVIGKGTPAAFDPPRRLVIRGPYRYLRNPMYLGAFIALAGAALYYRSWALAAYAGAFLIATHVFVVAYEEPTLRSKFGDDYERYLAAVGRWWPRSIAAR
jgi:protein-S-isoprenylcysteine O-methyltransferase Ste14